VVLEGDPRSALEVTREERDRVYEELWQHGGLGFYGAFSDIMINADAAATAAEFYRAKIRAIVHDPATAEALTPRGYHFATKRLCLGTNYYETYNRPNVSLVDVHRSPIDAFTAEGVRTRDRTILLDAVVFATGFDAVTGTLLKVDIRGEGGVSLQEKWASGPGAYLGLVVAGFPNLFVMGGPSTPTTLANELCALEIQVEWAADCIAWLRQNHRSWIDATPEAEAGWLAHVAEVADMTLLPTADSWYVGANIPGKPRVLMAYAAGVGAHKAKLAEVADHGYEGFVTG
jgi:cyclohexanone monooxygenase